MGLGLWVAAYSRKEAAGGVRLQHNTREDRRAWKVDEGTGVEGVGKRLSAVDTLRCGGGELVLAWPCITLDLPAGCRLPSL